MSGLPAYKSVTDVPDDVDVAIVAVPADAVQDVVLDMDIALEQGLTWLVDLCNRYDAGTLDRESAAKVKVECSRRASDLLTLAMEVCGGVACFDEFGLSRHHRDLFVCRVGEGSNFALKGFATRPLMPPITLD